MIDPNHPIVELLRRDRRFRPDAYRFVFEALRYGQDELGLGQPSAGEATGRLDDDPEFSGAGDGDEIRHVTGQQLCEAIRRYALQQYGPLAKNVLNHWGVQRTGDFGDIVFNLIDIGQMKKTDSDRREDFDDVFDFDGGLREAFGNMMSEPNKEQRP
jgi:uncharacterized repeat protein (TIGR04138 family)